MQKIVFLFLFFLTVAGRAQVVQGFITDAGQQPLPFVSVYLKSTTFGTTSNQKGFYRLQLKPGSYTLSFSMVGFQKKEFPITVRSGQTIDLSVSMSESTELRALEIYSDKRDIAREVVQQAREQRRKYQERMSRLRFTSYSKSSLEKDAKPDSSRLSDSLSVKDELNDHLRRESMNLIESVSNLYIDGNQVNEYIQAFRDYADTRPVSEVAIVRNEQFGEYDIAPKQYVDVNPYLLSSTKGFTEFDFYASTLDLPQLCEKPLLSPLGVGSALNYRYEWESTFYENNRKVYQIRVEPVFPGEALFRGTLFIEDSSFALTAVDLEINPSVLFFHRDFRIQQNYREHEPGVYLPYRREFIYTIKDGKELIHGNTAVSLSGFELNPMQLQGVSKDEVQTYDDEAFDRDSSYWEAFRTFKMKDNELAFIHKTDSLRRRYSDPEYLAEKDSAFNRITFWDVTLSGMAFRNRKKDYTLFINPLIAQMVFYGIGGYRHRLGGTFNKGFGNGQSLELEGDIDYGFANRDVRGKMGVGYTYIPKKFVRTFVRFGDFYDMINTYASLGSLFSRSNFVRAQTFSIAQRMEIVNGLFAELSYEFSDQHPINDLKQDTWSAALFGDVNEPIDFQRYTKSEFRIDLKYRPKQKYIIKRNRKIILGSKYPEFNLVYRKGVPGLLGSEVNFDYIELGATQRREIGRWGEMNWSVLAGTFFNQKSLRVLEHRFFRGSDRFFFSDPLRSFQLLGPTLSTSNAFLRANYIHQFNGLFLSKIPLIRHLKLTEAAGMGTLIVPEKNFRHAEVFFGLQKAIRIRKQLFRIGLYAVTADSSLNKAIFTWKIGFNFYNSFTRSWSF